MILKKSYSSYDLFEKNLLKGSSNLVLPKGKIVFTNGCFDILHHGHFRTLEESKALGDILIVGLNSDDSVKRLKGSERPINGWAKRAEQLQNISCVDFIIGFSEDTPLELITALRPHIITKGGDYKVEKMIGKDIVMSYGGEVVILPYHEGYSTTSIIEKGKE